ncbi:MAG TPA: DPP IV N-terminal domain-containing protein, partial [Vicinamibacteria bacterium]|nr:DPP IV N-terminal domain-containing protein [Vicinamibacteria bacterium]
MLVLALAAVLASEGAPTLDRLYSFPRLIGTAPAEPAWSADGKTLAFLWNESGYDFRDVYLVDVGSMKPRRLTSLSPASPPQEGDRGVVDVSFHPDGKSVLFQRGSELFRVSTEGGTPERVAEGSRAAFSSDGRLAYLHHGDLLSSGRSLAADPRAEVSVESFEWSPDGASLAFVEEDETRVPVRGIPDYLAKPEVALVPVRRPYPGETSASSRLGVVAASGAAPRYFDLGGEPVDPIFSYRWSRDGKLLVDTSDLYVKRRRILVVEPSSGAVREVYREDEPENVTAYWQAEWAPSGDAIYFLSDRDEDYHVYRIGVGGGAPTRITSGPFAVSQFAVTKTAVVFVAN